MAFVQFSQVSLAFGDRDILKNVSVNMQTGTKAALTGANGAGKSTLINRLVGKKATNVENKPGITKQLEWIRVNNQVELLDSPGILWPKLDNAEVALNLASTTAIKEEILDLEEVSIYIIKKC